VTVATVSPSTTPALDEIGDLRTLLFGESFVGLVHRLNRAAPGFANDCVVLQEDVGQGGLVDDLAAEDAGKIAARFTKLLSRLTERTSKLIRRLNDDLLLSRRGLQAFENGA
jgi:hypothetical protein